jgi:hypothetical protein
MGGYTRVVSGQRYGKRVPPLRIRMQQRNGDFYVVRADMLLTRDSITLKECIYNKYKASVSPGQVQQIMPVTIDLLLSTEPNT